MAEAAAEAAGDVIFAAAFPGGEVAGGANAAFTGVETEEDFTEGEEVEGHGGENGGEEVGGDQLEIRGAGGGFWTGWQDLTGWTGLLMGWQRG